MMNLATTDLARERRRDLLAEAGRRRLIAEAKRPRLQKGGSARSEVTRLAGPSLTSLRSSWPR